MSSKLSAPATAAECIQQEATLVLEHLTAEDTMSIGQATLEFAKALVPGRPVAIYLETDEHPLFVFYMDGTGAGNTDWINKKKNVTANLIKVRGQSAWNILNATQIFKPKPGSTPNSSARKAGLCP